MLLDPQGPDDTFFSCRRCACLGHHILERGIWTRRVVAGIDMSGFGDPPDGASYVRSICPFCGHVWSRVLRDDRQPFA